MNASSTLTLSIVLAVTSMPAFAQVPPPAPSPAPAATRVQVRTMENVFMTAVQSGVEQIAQKVTEAFPGLTVVGGVPRAHGYAIENYGWFFDVEVPELQWATIDLYVALQQVPPAAARPMNAGNAGVNGAIITPRPGATEPPIVRNPRGEYRKAIREALLDAMLDYGQVPLKPAEWLIVGARTADSPLPSLEMKDTVTLVMQITGEDLVLFRQAKITREEAKKRIKIKEEQR